MLYLTRWICCLAFLMVISVVSAHAQATRTWISGVGDDANPCSRTAPCKTIAGAISKTAAGGEIDILDPGGFGAVTITKSITIDGGGGSTAGVLVSGTNGIVVAAGATDVVILRNLDIDGIGLGLSGIRFNSGAMLYVEKCTIYGFTQYGIFFNPSATSRLSVDKTLVRENAAGGLYIKPANPSVTISASVSDSRFVRSPHFGLRADDASSVTVTNSIASHNQTNGFTAVAVNSGPVMMLDNCVATDNGWGVNAYGTGASIAMANSVVTANVNGLFTNLGIIYSYGNNRVIANNTNGAPSYTVSPE